MDGGEVFTAMRRIRHDVKVILCSGFSIQGKAMDILNRGAFAFIQKPYDIHNLLKTISDTLMM
jgi:DNA-binding NtrC family response regulator